MIPRTLSPPSVAMILVGAMPLVALFAFRGTVVVLVLLAMVGLWAVIKRQWTLPEPRLWLGFLALLLTWSIMSGLWAHTPGLAVPKAFSLLALSAAGILTLGLLHGCGAATTGRLLNVLVGAMAAVAAVAAADYAAGMPLARLVRGLGGNIPTIAMLVPPKAAATLFAIWGVLAAGACWSRNWRWRAAAAVVAAAVLVRVTSSNAGLLALLVGLGVLIAARFAPQASRYVLAAVVVVGFALGPLASALPDTAVIAEKIRWIPPSGQHRLAIWTFTGQRIVEKPFLGWGMDGSRALPEGEDNVLVTLHVDDDPTYCKPGMCVQWLQQLPLHPHNFILQIWVELGGVGASLFAGLVLSVIAVTSRLQKGQASTALATITAALAVASTGYGIWQAWWLAALLVTGALAAAFLRSDGRPETVGRLADAGSPC